MSTTAILSNSVRGRYKNDYIMAAKNRQVYEQFCYPIGESEDILQRSTSVTVPFLSGMNITDQEISETVDITPQSLDDATASISPTSRGDAIQDSEKLLIQNYTNYASQRHAIVGENMMETIEARAINAALNGSLVNRATARASLDAGTSGHRVSDALFFSVANRLKELRCPQAMTDEGIKIQSGFLAVMHPDAYYDLLSSGNVVAAAQYQNLGLLWNDEAGECNGFRVVSSPYAKVFAGAGADHGTNSAYVLTSDAKRLDKSLAITTATNVASGRYLHIGSEETGSTFYPNNERVEHISGTTTSVIVGGGANGGLRYDHAAGTAVRNADSVYPILFGGPWSVAKVYATEIGEFGEIVGPKKDGYLDQFVSLGWKWYGDYGRINENWLYRSEVSSSLDA